MIDFFTNDFKFRSLFQNHLNIAFAAWGTVCSDIIEKFESEQYEILAQDIQNLMTLTAKKYGDGLVGFMTNPNQKMLIQSGFDKELWLKAGVQSSEENKLFLIGEIFIQIDWIWQFMSNNNKPISRKQLNELFMRTDALRGIVDDLSTVCVNGKSAKSGGKKTNLTRDRCKTIIQTPEYNIRPSDARVHLVNTIQKIKDIYFDLYKEPLQKPNQKGIISPSDKTITNWFYEFSTNNLPGKRA